jgi:hypothetical protein
MIDKQDSNKRQKDKPDREPKLGKEKLRDLEPESEQAADVRGMRRPRSVSPHDPACSDRP